MSELTESSQSVLLQRVSEVVLEDGVQLRVAEALRDDSVHRAAQVLLEAPLEVAEGVSSTVVGLAVGLGVSVVVILGFVGFGYLLYRVSG